MDKGLELIKSFERCRLKSYHGEADASGIWTIGWGHVITGHEKWTHGMDLFQVGQTISQVSITQETADELFRIDVDKFVSTAKLQIPKEHLEKLNEDQFGAMISLIFNIGFGAFKSSSVFYKMLISDSFDSNKIANAGFKGWIFANKKPVNGLIIRRAAEKALFLGDYGAMQMFMARETNLINKAKKYLEDEIRGDK